MTCRKCKHICDISNQASHSHAIVIMPTSRLCRASCSPSSESLPSAAHQLGRRIAPFALSGRAAAEPAVRCPASSNTQYIDMVNLLHLLAPRSCCCHKHTRSAVAAATCFGCSNLVSFSAAVLVTSTNLECYCCPQLLTAHVPRLCQPQVDALVQVIDIYTDVALQFVVKWQVHLPT